MTAMIIILSFVLWGALALLAHTYAIYPVMMRLLARGRGLPDDRFERDEEMPEVAVLLAVYNEEKVLEDAISSILASDYPHGKMRLFIGSDGSTDRSEAIVKRFAKDDSRVRLVGFGGRNGKTRIINRLAEGATSEFADPDKAIFLLGDANVIWSPLMLRRIASHFKRGQVGLVGAAVSDRIREHDGIGERENVVNHAEGVLWGLVMGAFGACYALRARLFTPVPPHHIVDDSYLTLACLEQGRDVIVDLEAVCRVAVSDNLREEFRRKRRIAAGNFQNLARFWSCLQPRKSDLATTFAFWSHKGLRCYGPHLLVVALLSCVALSVVHPIHMLPLGGFATVLAMAGLDLLFASKSGRSVKLFRCARYFLSMNLAIGAGFLDYLRGPRTSRWEPIRPETAQSPSLPARSESRPEPLARR